MRRAIIAGVRAMDPSERHRQESRLVDRLATLDGYRDAGTVLVHVAAFPEEVATGAWHRAILDAGKRLACPRVDAARHQLDLFEVVDPDRDLAATFRNIREPTVRCRPIDPRAIDWAIIPGLAFDRSGHRLGRGGGYYDRLLPTLRPDAACWALILDAQWVDRVPREPHDRVLAGVADHESAWPGSARDASY